MYKYAIFNYNLLCLAASYIRILPATAAFSDSTSPSIGIFIFFSTISSISFDIPAASFPIIKAISFL
jgi:hypothetical protein